MEGWWIQHTQYIIILCVQFSVYNSLINISVLKKMFESTLTLWNCRMISSSRWCDLGSLRWIHHESSKSLRRVKHKWHVSLWVSLILKGFLGCFQFSLKTFDYYSTTSSIWFEYIRVELQNQTEGILCICWWTRDVACQRPASLIILINEGEEKES